MPLACANPTCDRETRTNRHDYRGKFCSPLCRNTARASGYRHLSDVAVPMALFHKIMEAAIEDAMDVDEWIVYALHDAVD